MWLDLDAIRVTQDSAAVMSQSNRVLLCHDTETSAPSVIFCSSTHANLPLLIKIVVILLKLLYGIRRLDWLMVGLLRAVTTSQLGFVGFPETERAPGGTCVVVVRVLPPSFTRLPQMRLEL